MFKKLLLSSRSQQGKEYRDLIVTLEGAAYDYMKIEMERARQLIETHKLEVEEHKGRFADLAKQIEDMRLSRVISGCMHTDCSRIGTSVVPRPTSRLVPSSIGQAAHQGT